MQLRGCKWIQKKLKTRLKQYFELTNPLVDFYKKKGCLSTEEVSESINRMGKDVAEDVIHRFQNKWK